MKDKEITIPCVSTELAKQEKYVPQEVADNWYGGKYSTIERHVLNYWEFAECDGSHCGLTLELLLKLERVGLITLHSLPNTDEMSSEFREWPDNLDDSDDLGREH